MADRSKSIRYKRLRGQLSKVASSVAKQVGRGAATKAVANDPASRESWAEFETLGRKYYVMLYLGTYFTSTKRQPPLQFWAGICTPKKNRVELIKLVKEMGVKPEIIEYDEFAGKGSSFLLPEKQMRRWHLPHVDVAHPSHSWFGRYFDVNAQDTSVTKEIATYLAELVTQIRGRLNVQYSDIDETEKPSLQKLRRIQNKFRSDIDGMWQSRCAISDSDTREVLRASHIKPWIICQPNERGDANNGLLLSAIYDALFDNGLMTVQDDGRIKYSKSLRFKKLDIDLKARLRGSLNPAQIKYLRWHRKHIFGAREHGLLNA